MVEALTVKQIERFVKVDDNEDLSNQLADAFGQGYNAGEQSGRSAGYDEGHADGVQEGKDEVTKKDYEMIAGILRAHKVQKKASVVRYHQWLSMVISFENALAKDNPSFRRSDFLEACYAVEPDAAKFLKLVDEK